MQKEEGNTKRNKNKVAKETTLDSITTMKKRVHILLFLFLGMLLGSLPLLGQTPIGTIKVSVGGNGVTISNWEANLSIEAEGAFSIEGAEGNPQGNKKLSGIFKIPGESFTIRGNITALTCSGNYLTILEIKDCPALIKLDCSNNMLKTLDVSGCTALRELNCFRNVLETLDVTENKALTKLDCSENQLITLELGSTSSNHALKELNCSKNQLKSLNIYYHGELEKLDCSNNQLEGDSGVSGLKKLVEFDCSNNQITHGLLLTAKTLELLGCDNNKLDGIYVDDCSALKHISFSGNGNTLKELYARNCTALEYLNVEDATILETLNLSECTALKYLTLPPSSSNKLKTLLLEGTALESLDCNNFSHLEELSVSGCPALRSLSCKEANLMTLYVGSCPALTWIDCSYNKLSVLDLSGCDALESLNCTDNLLWKLEGLHSDSLTSLVCSNNQLGSLKLWYCKALTNLMCDNNQLTELYFRENSLLSTISCYNNELKSLDVSGCPDLTELKCYRNQIKGEDMTNLVNSLPNRTGKEEGYFVVVQEPQPYGNRCTRSDVLLAEGKNWGAKKSTRPGPMGNLDTYKGFVPFTLTKDGEGTLTATGADDLNTVEYGTMLTIEATPAEGYNLVALTANGTDILSEPYIELKEATEVKAVFVKICAVTFTKEGEGTLNATGADDLDAVNAGTELTVEATPAEGYYLMALTANGVDILATKKFVIEDATEVKATFVKKTFGVTLTHEGEGTLNATGAADLTAVLYGTELTIEATPADGYKLTALTANDTDILESKTFVVTGATIVKATFANTKTFSVALTHEGEGTLNAIGSDDLNAVLYGTELTIEAKPAEGYYLMALTANGTDILATRKVVVKEAMEVKATFAKKTFAVTLTNEGEGTLNATGADNLNAVEYGTELTIEATPAEGYTLVSLTANGTDILSTRKVVVKEATEVKATFAKKTFAVTLTNEGEGTLNATGADNLNAVEYGTELTIEVTPAEGYELTALTANGTDILATRKVVVKEATEVKATFAKKTFGVTLTHEGEGTLNATGADNLNAVEYGTELTIEATPAEGYELTALTANGTDILATKKVVVKEATEVKATFAKKTFAVTLTKEAGEGTLKANGADNLNAVEYGTELTIEATPAEGYELTALTANGTDILATKKFVVKGATEIKATFTKKTAADRVEAGSVRIYPNPASAYVNVRAAKADALVRLYDANGTLLYEARTDDHGILQIELSAYAEGTYLLLVDGNAQHLLIQR